MLVWKRGSGATWVATSRAQPSGQYQVFDERSAGYAVYFDKSPRGKIHRIGADGGLNTYGNFRTSAAAKKAAQKHEDDLLRENRRKREVHDNPLSLNSPLPWLLGLGAIGALAYYLGKKSAAPQLPPAEPPSKAPTPISVPPIPMPSFF